MTDDGSEDSNDSPNGRRCLRHDIGDPQVGLCEGKELQRASRWLGIIPPSALRGKQRDGLNRLRNLCTTRCVAPTLRARNSRASNPQDTPEPLTHESRPELSASHSTSVSPAGSGESWFEPLPLSALLRCGDEPRRGNLNGGLYARRSSSCLAGACVQKPPCHEGPHSPAKRLPERSLRRLALSPPHRLMVRADAGRQCPIGCVVGSAFPMDVAAAEHSGWPNPLALTPFVMS